MKTVKRNFSIKESIESIDSNFDNNNYNQWNDELKEFIKDPMFYKKNWYKSEIPGFF